ncbi:MAG: DUF3570 domain-containing protein [Gammaproteobacteria bacterium]|jgi:hypothetical protein|nr:DUF3570 domain-containing protein [Gammaproteobacteria bacterium]MBT3860715.1 DUF3570 domain-containing protein [Gammaproteobacteria bacterium]MBT3988122.1 DUF3570 domain-containing protein [Gammaproteobacteria bacterium]MBT4255518.1 DUF3570 domain-containing protein [Gammaproteobacteria bacterium]MBT4583413.1 DUF3570 domain-containing protein [Gammaproteobacteria bacterium]
MQLKQPTGKITSLLAAATCSLLNQSSSAQEIPGWYLDSAVLSYSEKDRVDAVEPVLSATRVFADGQKLNLTFVADSLTGASPNGASISNVIQTFTRPSGLGTYNTEVGELPLDDTFKDSRSAFSAQYEFPLNQMTRLSTGLAYSDEYDYTSIGFNATLARDFNLKNTTLSLGFAYAADSIEPEGGIPIPFASTSLPFDQQRQGNDDDKTVVDLLFGVTQVINRRTLMQVNYSYSQSDGYLTEPFKLLSQVNGITGETSGYVNDSRPDTREKHSVYWKTKYSRDNGDIIDVSYRYLWDDWDINSHTIDARYRLNVNDKFYIEPHVRYYNQQEAEFFAHSLVAGQALPVNASADYRLGAFNGVTFGSKFGYKLTDRSEINFRAEIYEQQGDTVGTPIGIQNSYDMFPDLEATIFQIGYSYRF